MGLRVLKPDLVCDVGAEHAECPRWHEADQRLDWTDIGAGHFHRFDPSTGRDTVTAVGEPLGSFAPRRAGGYVLAVERGFAFLDLETQISKLVVKVEGCGPGGLARMNDGKCDSRGRFWAGSMSNRLDEPNGALYRLDGDLTITRMLDRVTISNGLDWAGDERTLYYIDTLALYLGPTSGIDAFDFDASSGTISNRRRLFDIPNIPSGPVGHCGPDGMTVDAEGFLWVAICGAGEVRRYSTGGDLDAVVEVPVPCPTSVTFGGPELSDLYITTMTLRAQVPEQFRTPHPAWQYADRGGIYRCTPGPRGRSAIPFVG